MRFQDAMLIAVAINKIQEVLNQYPDTEETYIGVEVSTNLEEQNFFMSNLADLMGLQRKVEVIHFPDKNFPYEVRCWINNVEIHSICTLDDLTRFGLEDKIIAEEK